MKHVQRGVLVRKSVWGGTQLSHSSGYIAPSQKKISAVIEKIEKSATYCVGRLGLHGFRYDCYSPKYQFCYAVHEVFDWFKQNGLEKIDARPHPTTVLGFKPLNKIDLNR